MEHLYDTCTYTQTHDSINPESNKRGSAFKISFNSVLHDVRGSFPYVTLSLLHVPCIKHL